MAEAGALDRAGPSAAVAGLRARHPEYPPQDGGPARVPARLQPALWPVRECSASSAPPPGPQSEQLRRPCVGGRGPRGSEQSQDRSDACSCPLTGVRPSASQGSRRPDPRARAAIRHLAFPAKGLRKGNDLLEPVRRGGPRRRIRLMVASPALSQAPGAARYIFPHFMLQQLLPEGELRLWRLVLFQALLLPSA